MDLDIVLFRELYPQFNELDDTTLELLWQTQFVIATKIVSIVKSTKQIHWRFLVLAHLCQLQINNVVGRLSQTTQGSVNVALQYDGTYQWWNQTIYGSQIATVYRMVGIARLI